jgi:hypothetical protein
MSQPNADLNVLNAPACQHLRSKGMYVTGLMDPYEDGHSDGYCWCNQTAGQYGPDDQYVDRTTCKPGRTCYQAVL